MQSNKRAVTGPAGGTLGIVKQCLGLTWLRGNHEPSERRWPARGGWWFVRLIRWAVQLGADFGKRERRAARRTPLKLGAVSIAGRRGMVGVHQR
jgi:hypothetical protein